MRRGDVEDADQKLTGAKLAHLAQTYFGWLMRQGQALLLRLEGFRRREAELVSYETQRAQLCWDADRRCEAEDLGDKLARRPAVTRAKLVRSKHGASWLLDRWKALGAILDRQSTWTDAQKSLAFDLLGIAPNLRDGEPWISAGLDSPPALVDRERLALETLIQSTLEPLDQIERTAAREGRPLTPSQARRQLRREEAEDWKRHVAVQKTMEVELERMIEAGEETRDEEEISIDFEPSPSPTYSIPAPAARSEMASRPPALPSADGSVPISASPPPSGNRRARRAALRRQRQASGTSPGH